MLALNYLLKLIHLSNFKCSSNFDYSATLGVDRRSIKSLYRVPDRENIFQLVQYVDKVSIR